MTIREIPEFSVIMNASYFKDLKTMHEITDRYTANVNRQTTDKLLFSYAIIRAAGTHLNMVRTDFFSKESIK